MRKLFCKALSFQIFTISSLDRTSLQANLRELFQSFWISISSWLFEAIFLWKMDEYLVLKRDSWTRKNVEVSMERIRSRFWFYRSHSRHLQSTASVDRIERPWSMITQPTIDFGNNILFEFQFRKCFGIVLSSYREDWNSSNNVFPSAPRVPFFFLFFFRKCYPLLNNQNIIIFAKFHKLKRLLKRFFLTMITRFEIWDLFLKIYAIFSFNFNLSKNSYF